MTPQEQLVSRLFECVNAHDPDGAAACYAEDATFHDIAFDLHGKRQIHAMWKMICLPNKLGVPSTIRVTVNKIKTEGDTVLAEIVDDYSVRDKDDNPANDRHVTNKITAVFAFDGNGKILIEHDDCNTLDWAREAIGGIFGEIVGRIGFVRRRLAMSKLRKFDPKAFA